MNLAYVAGLLDGEGSIGFTRNRSGFTPRVSITNTNLELLEDLKESFGGHIQRLSHRKSGWKQGYSWVVVNSAAVEFVEKVIKWLRLKDEQALLLFCWDAVRPGKQGVRWTEEAIDTSAFLNEQSKWLNMKGNNRPDKSPLDIVLESYK